MCHRAAAWRVATPRKVELYQFSIEPAFPSPPPSDPEKDALSRLASLDKTIYDAVMSLLADKDAQLAKKDGLIAQLQKEVHELQDVMQSEDVFQKRVRRAQEEAACSSGSVLEIENVFAEEDGVSSVEVLTQRYT